MKKGKRYAELTKLVDRTNNYDPQEAVALVKKLANAKFDETIEAHIRTGCDGRHADQQIRGAVVLPHGTGKTVRVLVFAKNAKAADGLSYRCNTCKKHGFTKTKTSRSNSVDMSELSDEALCGELRRRGFTGELSYRKTISI